MKYCSYFLYYITDSCFIENRNLCVYRLKASRPAVDPGRGYKTTLNYILQSKAGNKILQLLCILGKLV